MFDDKSDRASVPVQNGTVKDAVPQPGADRAKGFKSRRMPLTVAAYKYLVIETGREIALVRAEPVPTPSDALGRYRERHSRRVFNPAEVRERLQGLLLDGLLVARMRLPSGVIVRVSSEAFGDDSGDTFDRMERGQPITALVFANDLLDASLDVNEITGEQTGVVFFYEEEFRAAQATDPITEIDGYEVPTGTAVIVPVPRAPVDDRAAPSGTGRMGPAIPDARSAAARAKSVNKLRGRRREYPDLPEAIHDVLTNKTERYKLMSVFHTEVSPKLGKNPPSDKTIERRAAEHPRWTELKPPPASRRSRA